MATKILLFLSLTLGAIAWGSWREVKLKDRTRVVDRSVLRETLLEYADEVMTVYPAAFLDAGIEIRFEYE